MTDLLPFAEAERLKIRRDPEDNSRTIPGKLGHIWEYGEGKLSMTLLELTPRKWNFRRKLCLGAGMALHQDGDWEGTCLFDPTNPEQVEVALKVAGITRVRRLSPEHRMALVEAGRAARFKPSTVLQRVSSDFDKRQGPKRGRGKGKTLSTVSYGGREAA